VPDDSLPAAQITHALLMDLRTLLKSIKDMLTFFTVLVVIGLVVGVFIALSS